MASYSHHHLPHRGWIQEFLKEQLQPVEWVLIIYYSQLSEKAFENLVAREVTPSLVPALITNVTLETRHTTDTQ